MDIANFLLDDGSTFFFEKSILSKKSSYFDAYFNRWHPTMTEYRWIATFDLNYLQ